MHSTIFAISPISPVDANRLRAAGGKHYVVDAQPGFPCRQCLRDADIGDDMILVSHDPFTATAPDTASPYRSASPIFLHRDDCGEPVPTAELPSQLTVRQLSVRSFDENEMIIDATVIDGEDLASTIDEMFANELSQMLHVHNAQRCRYAARIDRI